MPEAKDKFIAAKITEHIIENRLLNGNTFDVEDVNAIKAANLELSKGEKYAVLVWSEEFTVITKEARELVASKEFAQNTMAKALIVANLAQQIIVNFYLKINRPYIKTKAFRTKEEGIKWLKEIEEQEIKLNKTKKEVV